MALSDIQYNTIDQLLDVLECLGDPQAQICYKNTVPFVHIPEELFSQWENYPRLAEEERDWFMEIFSARQIESLLAFDQEVLAYWNTRGDESADVPEVISDELWLALGRKALILKEDLVQDNPSLWQEYHRRKQAIS